MFVKTRKASIRSGQKKLKIWKEHESRNKVEHGGERKANSDAT